MCLTILSVSRTYILIEMFPIYYIYSDICSWLKYVDQVIIKSTYYCVTRDGEMLLKIKTCLYYNDEMFIHKMMYQSEIL